MDPTRKDESERKVILITGDSPASNGIRTLIEESNVARVVEADSCQPSFDPPEDNRAAHIGKRAERKHYRQWEHNLRSKMRGWVK